MIQWPPRVQMALIALVASVIGAAVAMAMLGWGIHILWRGGWLNSTQVQRIAAIAYISYVEQQADSDDDIIVVVSGRGQESRQQQRAIERLMHMATGRSYYAAIRFNGDEAAARAEAVAHAAERRAQLARLYA